MDVNNLGLFFEGSIPSTTQREERKKIALTTPLKQTRLKNVVKIKQSQLLAHLSKEKKMSRIV
jgi:hypothetical protein